MTRSARIRSNLNARMVAARVPFGRVAKLFRFDGAFGVVSARDACTDTVHACELQMLDVNWSLVAELLNRRMDMPRFGVRVMPQVRW